MERSSGAHPRTGAMFSCGIILKYPPKLSQRTNIPLFLDEEPAEHSDREVVCLAVAFKFPF